MKIRRLTRFFVVTSVLNLFFTSCLLIIFYQTYLAYQNPYSYAPVQPQLTISSRYFRQSFAQYTLIFLIDGLRYDIMHQVRPETINQLLTEGTEFTEARCFSLLSSSVPGASAVGSGSLPWVSEVINNEYKGTVKTDSVFWVAKRFDNTTAIIGGSHVFALFSDYIDYWKNEPAQQPEGMTSDAQVGDWAANQASTHLPNFMWVHLSDTDHVAHTHGSLNSEYRNAIEVADEQIRKVLDVYEAKGVLDSTLVVVASDHGQVDPGGHGGVEPEVLHVPLILWSPGVINAGQKIDNPVYLDSIAPTVSMIMGWDIPSDASGTILFEALTTSNEKLLATYKIHLAEIRLTQANITLHKTGLVEKYLATWNNSLQLLEAAKAHYEQEPTTSNDLAETSELMSHNILSYVPLGSALYDRKQFELSARSQIAYGLISVVLILVLMAVIRVRKRGKKWFITEKTPIIFTVCVALLYYALFFLLMWISLSPAFGIEENTLQLSPSYLKSYKTFFLFNLGVTVGSLVASGSFMLLFTVRRLAFSKTKTLKWTVAFLISIMTVNTLILSTFYFRGSCGISWFTFDVKEGLACSYIAVSNVISSIFALLYYIIIDSFNKRLFR